MVLTTVYIPMRELVGLLGASAASLRAVRASGTLDAARSIGVTALFDNGVARAALAGVAVVDGLPVRSEVSVAVSKDVKSKPTAVKMLNIVLVNDL